MLKTSIFFLLHKTQNNFHSDLSLYLSFPTQYTFEKTAEWRYKTKPRIPHHLYAALYINYQNIISAGGTYFVESSILQNNIK